ncbi:MerR family transcriptional regulator [Nocardiopsis terrae]|uniref:DNA-binding transcriptional MerR regulator n=1 Tax=Nocardiopsis terrae TaxID=372655 RepID=A0ABR9H9T9_9ACTN|nr:MerR family transcriptional regulator [Nocardiopsis terrae]MBE1455809.1 DNA-binding transcriptional MerR regulator [Nocardiopsis terrae]GHC92631.1 MerR family transcriptional regulator [Nocardiopsis terrae]
MRISELSERSGVSVPTIKYYVREGLLHRGELTSPNQARYDESHLDRLRLIGALTEVGGLSVAATRDLLQVIDGDQRPELGDLMGLTLKRVDGGPGDGGDVSEEDLAAADALAERHGWHVHPGSALREELARVMAALEGSGFELTPEWLDGYADAAGQTARLDHDYVEGVTNLDGVLRTVVVGTVLGERLLASLRRLAQASEARRRHGG